MAFLDRPGSHVQQTGRTTAVAHGGQVDDHGGRTGRPSLVWRHTEGVPPAWERSARGNPRPRGPPHHRSGEDRLTVWPERLSGLRCWRCARSSPRADATRETDMHSRARARSPHSAAAWVSRALGSAKVEVSCLHTRRQWVQAKRRRRTTSCVGLHPTGTWARCRATVPRDTPWAPQALQKGSSNPIGMRHSTMALVEVRCWPTAVSPRASRPRNVVRSGSVEVVSGTSRSLNWVV